MNTEYLEKVPTGTISLLKAPNFHTFKNLLDNL